MKRDVKAENYFEYVEKVNIYTSGESKLPNSIPSISNFVGRENYLTELREAHQNGTRGFVLHGIGGVGKTASALQLAGEIAGGYEAKIFVDMRGMSKNPLSARDAMLEIVRQFDREVPADIPDTQLKTLFVSKVQNQSTLIVLDNTESKESVEPLIQAKACVIVTSRQSFRLTGSESKQILKMSPEDARDLLYKNAGEERFDGRADELAYLAGYLPMALKPLAALLAEDELETAADLIERYRDKQALLKERVPDYDNLTIEASFELSYEKLSDEMKERWRRLSVFPSDFDEKAVEAVLSISAEEAKKTQKLLRKFSLLEVTPETIRFNLHDLVRAFTDARLSEDERFDIQLRHAKHYAMLLQIAQSIQKNDCENGYINSLKLIDIEWSNITTGQKWTANFSESGSEIALLCCNYSLFNFIDLRLHPHEYIAWQKSAEISAQKLGNKHYQASNLSYMGGAYRLLGEYRKAIECFEKALMISREINNQVTEGANLANLGLVYNNLGENQKTIEYCKKALAISRKASDLLNEGNQLCILGCAYFDLHDYRKAITYFEQALAIARKSGDRRNEGNCLGNIGNTYGALSNLKKEIEYCEQALEIARELGDRQVEGVQLQNLGNAYWGKNSYQETIEYYEQALIIAREIGDRASEGVRLGNLGIVYKNLGNAEKACMLWKEATAILESIESTYADSFRQWLKGNCPK